MLDSTHFLVRTLLDDGEITRETLAAAQKRAADSGGDLLRALTQVGGITTKRLSIVRAKICEYPFVDLEHYDIDIRHAKLYPRSAAERDQVFPLFIIDGVATIGMVDPMNIRAIDQARQLLRCEVDPVVCDPEQIRTLIGRAYSIVRAANDNPQAHEDRRADSGNEEEPIVAAVNQIIAAAVACGASDIHLNPDDRDLHLRYRVDGVLRTQQAPGRSAHDALVQRLKVMAGLDVTQTRRPQDGKFRFEIGETYVDVRLSLLPTIHGENAVLRLLRPAAAIGTIDDLDMPSRAAAAFKRALTRPNGMILVTGPTGSGKTTTLYTALASLNSPDRNIMTIEDPVELRLPLIRQVQANHEIGFGFAEALRSILRQDPDVVLVGEIRDTDTARIATRAAMTGHLVLSTLHTNDAVGAVPRLLDMGVPDYAVNGSLLGVIAQRLVRRVCDSCAQPDAADEQTLQRLGIDHGGSFVSASGCPRCNGTGYTGRLGVFEMLEMSHEVRAHIEQSGSAADLLRIAAEQGMESMLTDGIRKARQGLTTLEEISRLGSMLDDAQRADSPRMAA